jgi:hypothetical protein
VLSEPRLYNATLGISAASSVRARVQLATVQFTPAHDKESRVQKTEVKIRLQGRAVQNTEIEDRVSSLCVVKL